MELKEKIQSKKAIVGVIGLGYVGLPLLIEFIEVGFNCIGFDIDEKKVNTLNQKKSYIKHIPQNRIEDIMKSGQFMATTDFSQLAETDCILVAVPTPLDRNHQPDLSFIINTSNTISKYLKKGQMVILESSTWPGTTDEVMKPILEKSGLRCTEDFYLAFSPEREDPNNPNYSTKNIPKVVGANDAASLEYAKALYDAVIIQTVPVSSSQAAEATKLLENIFRSVNIALVNEMKMILDRMFIDVWEVIDAASTKPFGYMPFYPGPGLGGHCIPIDPFYLTWKAREYDMPTRFIELAGEINTNMPYWVVNKVMEALNVNAKSLNGARILILGAAYKKNVDDIRESPTLKLIEILEGKGALVDYNDPFVPVMPHVRKYQYDMKSVEITPQNLQQYDAVIISTAHDAYDYETIVNHAQLIIDTRNATKDVKKNRDKIVKA
ncbi:nucleotide sugar dehydrogenase [bacterium]|nr:nucleotide sugar dehydrogenase [bacterium]RQV93727.1 MAG: nucleotide sugar dehydrogenase [bacterium]